MGFSAYILETLNRYGRADLGALGSFVLQYSPAEWKVIHQNFEPPKAELTWLPADSTNSYTLLARVVASLHDIPFGKAYDFVGNTIDNLVKEDATPEIPLGILGHLQKTGLEGAYQYSPNAALGKLMKFESLSIPPAFDEEVKGVEINWWLALGSAALLGVIYILLNLLFNTPASKTAALKLTNPPAILENTSLKQTNIAPQQDLKNNAIALDIAEVDQTDFIIITGTFCQANNALKMKNKIRKQGLTAYEENLKEGCKRLGIISKAGVNRDSMLQSVRSTLEPTAWILDQ